MKQFNPKSGWRQWVSHVAVWCLLILFGVQMATAQDCQNGSKYPSSAIVAPSSTGFVTTISTCNYLQEYSEIGSVSEGAEYKFTVTNNGYITVRVGAAGGPVLGAGSSPLTVTTTSSSNLFVHWNTNSSCGTASGCVTTAIELITAGSGGGVDCQNSTKYPSGAVSAPSTTGFATTINTCNYLSEYSEIGNITNGADYKFTVTNNGYITVRVGSVGGPILDAGSSPLTVTTSSAFNLFVHWNTNSNCGTASGCVTTAVELMSAGSGGGVECQNTTHGNQWNTINAPTVPGVTTIKTGYIFGEYSQISSVASGTDYQFTATNNGYITVRVGSAGGTVLGSGFSPLTITTTNTLDLYVHWNSDANCGTNFNYVTATIACTSCQAPAGPCDAAYAITSLPVNGQSLACNSSNQITGSNVNSVCGSSNYYGGNEALYTFTPTTSGDYKIDYSGQTYVAIIVYQGCPLTGSCVGNVSTSSSAKSLTVSLMAGTEYFIMFDIWPSPSSPCPGSFSMTEIAPPANDDCGGAYALTANTPTAGTLGLATASSQGVSPCSGTANNDVWFSFVATHQSHEIGLINVSPYTDMYHAVYSGSCGSLINIKCSDPDNSTLTGLTPGNTYYVRVYSYYSTAVATNFEVLLSSPPANDECADAISLTVNPTDVCSAVTAGTIERATGSSQSNPCSGTANNDVWFSFVATSPVHTIDLLNLSPSYDDLYLSVSSGSCGSLTNVLCSNYDNNTVNGLTPGNTYYVRVYSYYSGSYSTTFGICVGTLNPPANDECAGAYSLSSDEPVSGSLELATPSPQNNPCFGGNANNDVWFSFVATHQTHELDLINVSPYTDMYHAVYSGSCGTLTNIKCSDPDNSTLTGLTVGNTYYVRVYSYYSTAVTTTFDVLLSSPPANDDCAMATNLVMNTNQNCTNTSSGTLSLATQSGEVNSCYGNPNDDVWYSFTATGTAHSVAISNISSGSLYADLYTGSCGSLTNELCNSNMSFIKNGLTPGETYYLRIYSSYGTDISFDVCVSEVPVPDNDDCAYAETIVPNTDASCNDVVSGTLFQATASGESGGCSYANSLDVWYTFVATHSQHKIEILNVSQSYTSVYHSVLQGSCGALTSVDCGNSMSANIVSGLTAGQTYYLRVYATSSSPTQPLTFDVCISSPPVNDDCVNATALTVNSDLNCTAVTSGTVDLATGSGENNTCSGTPDNDVWFSFVATSVTHQVNLLNIAGSNSYPYLVTGVYEGSCGNLNTLECSTADSTVVNQLTIGETYYVRVYSSSSTYWGPEDTTFDVCVTTPPVPANDECVDAELLAASADETCITPTSGTLYYATESGNAGACLLGTPNDDVWYSFIATNYAHSVEFTNIAGSVTDLIVGVYSGSCESLTQVKCEYGWGYSSSFNTIADGLTEGETYYVRVYSQTSTPGQNTTFDICITTPPAPANDECAGAFSVPVNPDMGCGSTVYATLQVATESPEANNCNGTANNDVWFSFVATNSSHSVDLYDYFGFYSDLVFGLYHGQCGEQTSMGCVYSSSTLLNGLVAGQTYYLRVYGYYDEVSSTSFEVCIGTPPPPPFNDYCASPRPLMVDGGVRPVHNIGATGSGGSFSCAPGAVQNDVWFSFQATGSGVEIETSAGSMYTLGDSRMQVLDACGGNVIACDDNSGSGNYSLITIDCSELIAGNTYYIQVDGVDGAYGYFDIDVRSVTLLGCTNPAAINYDPCATNDDGSCLIPIASCGPDNYTHCYANNEDNQYLYTASSGTDLYLMLTSGVIGTGDVLNVYDGYSTAANLIYTATESLSVGQVVHSTTGQLMVQILSDGSQSCADDGLEAVGYTIGCDAPGNISTCATAQNITAATFPAWNTTVDNLWLIGNDQEPVCDGVQGASLYYTFDVAEKNHYGLKVNPYQGADLVVEVLDGCGGTVLACVNNNGAGGEESVLLENLAPGTYIVRVHNASGVAEAETTGGFMVRLQKMPFAGVQNNPASSMYACNQSEFELSDFIGAIPQTGGNSWVMDYKWLVAEEMGGFIGEFQRNQPNYVVRISWLGMVPGKTYNVFVSILVNHPDFGPVWTVYNGNADNPNAESASPCTVSTTSSIAQTELLTAYSSMFGAQYNLCDIVIAQNIEGAENFRWRFDLDVNTPGDELIYTRGSGNPSVRLSWVSGIQPGSIYQVDVQVQVDGNWSTYGVKKPLEIAGVPHNVSIRPQYCGGTYGANSVILSEGVCEADYYRFRLIPVAGGPAVYRTSGNYVLFFNGPLANLAPGDYILDVKVSQNGQAGDFGPDCLITIGGPTAPSTGGIAEQRNLVEQGSATLYPNPSSGEEVRVTLSGLTAGNHDVLITVYDLYGKQISTQSFGHEGETLNRLVRFNEGLSTGVYMVQFVIDGEIHATERLVVN